MLGKMVLQRDTTFILFPFFISSIFNIDEAVANSSLCPVGTRHCSDIGFLLDLHRDIDHLRIEIEVASLYDIFFQHHNDVVAITQHNVKLHVIVIPIFNVVLISDKDENAINNGKHFVLFYFSSSRPEMFCKKGVLRIFAKFTGKYLCQSLFF